jgi:hypothetical protein
MVQTDDDVSAGRFLSLPFARAYLEQHTRARPYAELLLQRGLASGFIRYHAHETEVHFPDRGKPPVPDRVLVPAPPHDGAGFWRTDPFDENPRLEIEWERSDATRTDYAVQLLDGTWQTYRIVRKRGIRVSQDDLDAMLEVEQLMPARVTATLVSSVPTVQPPPISVPEPTPPPLQPQSQPQPKPKRVTLKSWVPEADAHYAKTPGQLQSERAKDLHRHIPADKSWTVRAIANELSNLKKVSSKKSHQTVSSKVSSL